MNTILIIEDEKDIVEAIEYNLLKEGFKTSKAYDGINGLHLAREKKPDLILLDLMLPGLGGIEICKTLKNDPAVAAIPIIILTAKSEEIDRVLGLELGADDYISKPFSMRELVARIKTVLKRSGRKEIPKKRIIEFPDLKIDIARHEATACGKLIELTAKEFALLLYLAENEGNAIVRDKLLDTVWGVTAAIETRTVDVHITRVREKLGKAGRHIQTLRGVGYKFVK